MRATCLTIALIACGVMFAGCADQGIVNRAHAQQAPADNDDDPNQAPKVKQKSLFDFFNKGGGNPPKLIRIKKEPEDLFVLATTTNSFEVQVVGLQPNEIAYQWRHNGTNLPGRNEHTLILERIGSTNVGEYTCEISTEWETVISPSAHLSIFYPSTNRVERPQTTGQTYTIETGDYSGTSGTLASCPGAYAARARFPAGTRYFTRQSSGPYTATTPNTGARIAWQGNVFTNRGCATNSVTIPTSLPSSNYFFTVYYSNPQGPPYRLDVTGFTPVFSKKAKDKENERP